MLDSPDSRILTRKDGPVPLVHKALRSYEGALFMSFGLVSAKLKSER